MFTSVQAISDANVTIHSFDAFSITFCKLSLCYFYPVYRSSVRFDVPTIFHSTSITPNVLYTRKLTLLLSLSYLTANTNRQTRPAVGVVYVFMYKYKSITIY